MSEIRVATIDDVRAAVPVIREHFSAPPLIRSYRLEKELGLPPTRQVWIKDYGWTPVGSFKLMGALNWMHQHRERIGNSPVAAHSSGNFASGLAFAGSKFGVPVKVVMPDNAPQVKCELTRSYGAEILRYDSATDHETGERDRKTQEVVDNEHGVMAHPYNDPAVIAGNGVGGMEVAETLQASGRGLSHFVCAVSGGGLMAGHALAIKHFFPQANILGVEPTGGADFQQSLEQGQRVRIERPESICDGLLSYEVGEHNWPILRQAVAQSMTFSDQEVRAAMRWLYDNHGLRTEPSGAITTAALLGSQRGLWEGDGDIVVVVSGRNVDEEFFQRCIA